jgi:shikimate kinase|tara:strand:+ start:94 stop:654 length:561 start_codon:yes stop_codon:yes gene_type:complete
MNITIVGPRSVGKSTISKMLSAKLKYKYLESDNLMHIEMKEYGGLDKAIKSGKTESIMKKGPAIVEKALVKNKIVFDLAGGAISSRTGTEMGVCQKVIKTISKESYVVGLLPYENDDESIKLLCQREKKREHFSEMDSGELNAKVEKDYLKLKPILKKVSNLVVYVEKKNPESIVDEIFQQVQQQL